MHKNDYQIRVEECCSFLREYLSCAPKTIIQLGTGLGNFATKITAIQSIAYAKIPGFPVATVESHAGNLIVGKIGNHDIVILQGRFHFYEGYSAKEVALPVRVLSLLGAENLILTNAAGGLNPLFQPGTIMVIRDHLNFLGENPLRGPNVESWGPRFPDLSEPYPQKYVKIALDSATRCGLTNVVTGVYVCIPGPSLETPAETRWLRQSGADAVGMSSIPEVLTAIHAGMKVIGLSAIANVNDPDNFSPILLEDIVEQAAEMEPQMEKLIIDITHNL